MRWVDVKEEIRHRLKSRGLAVPRLRLDALISVDRILKEHYPNIIAEPTSLLQIGKAQFKQQLGTHKANGKLNKAEESIVNDIYAIILSISKRPR